MTLQKKLEVALNLLNHVDPLHQSKSTLIYAKKKVEQGQGH